MSVVDASSRSPSLNVVAFYHFAELTEPEALVRQLRDLCQRHALLGTVHVAPEGVNGTVCGADDGIAALGNWLQETLRLDPASLRRSTASAAPFRKLLVRSIAQILPDPGAEGVSPSDPRGEHVDPDDWDALLDDPDVRVIDVRNAYEIAVGSFPEAESPLTDRFTDFGEFVAQHLDPERDRHVAMFCTGGIRCEKASAWMLKQGFERVSQLRGGVLNYFETQPQASRRWRGDCFVFDHRVALSPQLDETAWIVCHGCRRPVSEEDQQHRDFHEGVCCPGCAPTLTESRRRMLEERARQFLAANGPAGRQ